MSTITDKVTPKFPSMRGTKRRRMKHVLYPMVMGSLLISCHLTQAMAATAPRFIDTRARFNQQVFAHHWHETEQQLLARIQAESLREYERTLQQLQEEERQVLAQAARLLQERREREQAAQQQAAQVQVAQPQVETEEQECGVCLEQATQTHRLGRTTCGHTFCHDCLNQWLQNHTTCPICRATPVRFMTEAEQQTQAQPDPSISLRTESTAGEDRQEQEELAAALAASMREQQEREELSRQEQQELERVIRLSLQEAQEREEREAQQAIQQVVAPQQRIRVY